MNIGAFIIKPDSILLGLSDFILKDIEASGLKILYKKDIQIKEEQLPILYPRQHEGEEYPSVVKLFNMGLSTLVIVELPDNFLGESSYSYLKRVRGKAREGGIRDKYLFEYKEDLIARGLSGAGLTDELAKNRIHAPEDEGELKTLIKLFVSVDDIKDISNSDYELAKNLILFKEDNVDYNREIIVESKINKSSFIYSKER